MTQKKQEQERFYQIAEEVWKGLDQRMMPFGEVNLSKIEGLGVYYQGAFYTGDGWNIIDRIDILINPLVQTISAYVSPRTSSQINSIFLTADSRLFLDRHKKNIRTGGWVRKRKIETEITHWAILKKEVPGAHPLYLASSSPVFPFYDGEKELKEISDMGINLGSRLYIHRDITELCSRSSFDSPCSIYYDRKFPEEGELVPMQYLHRE